VRKSCLVPAVGVLLAAMPPRRRGAENCGNPAVAPVQEVSMKRFANDQDRRVYEAALPAAPAHHLIGDALECQFEARLDFPSGGGAILTEDELGTVRVSYYRSVRSLKAAWIDAVHSHADCCLYAAAVA
jgi:hypothetical protein